jgi:lycopene beta-cyclase
LSPLSYLHVSSIDLYRESKRIVEQYGMLRIHEPVRRLHAAHNGVEVHTSGGVYRARKVFDSRPPQYLPADRNEAHLLQSFTGYVVVTEKPVADADCIDLMDFDVEQSGYTQFVYVLPFASDRMLVELTRFGAQPVRLAEAAPILDRYITRRFGNYTIAGTETGCIPMSTAAIRCEAVPGVIPIGGRAGAVKPSTGYAFKNMFRHAESICEALQKEIVPEPVKSPARFRLYDRLLLMILLKKPQLGRSIFNTLFRRNNTAGVLRFLDERTGFLEDLRILLSLPVKPFIAALCNDLAYRYRALLAPVLVLLLAVGLLVMQGQSPELFIWVQTAIFSLGLLWVGIPHGALDHLLETGNLQFKVGSAFVAKYLGAGAAYLLLWLAAPNLALLFFLLFSAWHFGEGDMQQFAPRQPGAIKNFFWGGLVLGGIILGHAAEANLLLGNMGVIQIGMNPMLLQQLPLLFILTAAIWGIAERRPAMVLSALMLGVCLKLPLITSFGLYFLGQHSLNTWGHLKKGFQADSLSLFTKALPFTVGALLLFFAALAGLKAGWFEAFNGHAVTVFFVFISCISFPHVIAMHGFYREGKHKLF